MKFFYNLFTKIIEHFYEWGINIFININGIHEVQMVPALPGDLKKVIKYLTTLSLIFKGYYLYLYSLCF